MLAEIKWNRGVVRDFLGSYLTEPKSHVYFEPPQKPLTFKRFAAATAKLGVKLDAKTQLLFSGRRFFINGEECESESGDQAIIRQLADQRSLASTGKLSEDGVALLYAWYCDGFLIASAK
ncbi:MAG TPA: winged helix domain-containing protein [Rhodocyclaceae bacterium]|nr:winged helix domain-containing protein [Rhodocyclaceae bacterium]